jgi:hypothetical protein
MAASLRWSNASRSEGVIMKRSRTISLILIPTILVPITACDEPDQMYCTDDAGTVIADSNCETDDLEELDGGSPTDADAGVKRSRSHFWYYAPGSGRTTVIQQGGKVRGGGYVPNPNRHYASPHNPNFTFRPSSGYSTPGSFRASPSVRGGFGGTGRSMGGSGVS